MKNKALALLLVTILILSMAFGCNTTDDTTESQTPPPPPPSEQNHVEDNSEVTLDSEDTGYPLVDTPVTLTCYWPFDFSYQDIVDYADEQFFRGRKENQCLY